MTKSRRDKEGSARRARVEHSADAARYTEEETPRRPASRREHPPVRSGGGLAYVIVPLIVVVMLGGGVLWFVGSQKNGSTGAVPASAGAVSAASSEEASLLSDVSWPPYVARGSAGIKEAYQYAVLRPDVLKYMPCYCGCGQHNGHRSNEECFIADMKQGGRTIAFEQHGST